MRPVQKGRFDAILILGAVALFLIVSFLFYRQIVQAEEIGGLTSTSTITLRPERGTIYSADGVPLAQNTSIFFVGVSPREIRFLTEESRQQVAVDIKRVMGIPDSFITAEAFLDNYLVAHDDNTFEVVRDKALNWTYRDGETFVTRNEEGEVLTETELGGERVPTNMQTSETVFFRVYEEDGSIYSDEAGWLPAKMARLKGFGVEKDWFKLLEQPRNRDEAEQLLDRYGVYITRAPFREYPQRNTTSHVVGVVQHLDIQGSTAQEDMQGTFGVEQHYHQVMRGQAREIERPASPFDPPSEETATDGDDLVLTINMAIQSAAEKYLTEGIAEYEAVGGSVIVMEPDTGALLALVNKPDFDPTDFSEIYTSDERDLLLTNKAISEINPPGSVMKLLTAAMALDSGVATPNWSYQDTVYYECFGHQVQNWNQEGHGLVDMEGMLAMSLNIGSSKLARAVGVDNFYNYMQALRFDTNMITKVDLSNEARPNVLYPGDTNWTDLELCTNSFGQGFSVTPLQILSAVSTIANNGIQMQPHIVKERHMANGDIVATEPVELGRPFSPAAANAVNQMAANAVIREIGVAQLDGYTVAGKTSTADLPNQDEFEDTYDTMGTFIGWFPHDNPEVIVLVNIEKPQTTPYGSETAAPVFAKIAKEIVLTLNIPPDSVRTAQVGQ